ncbi:ARM repeat superfamily protein, partial [Striga asiatica]
ESKNKKYISNSKSVLKSEIDVLENRDVILLYETNEELTYLSLLHREDHNNGQDSSVEYEVTTPLKIGQVFEHVQDMFSAKWNLMKDLSGSPDHTTTKEMESATTESKGKAKIGEKQDFGSTTNNKVVAQYEVEA